MSNWVYILLTLLMLRISLCRAVSYHAQFFKVSKTSAAEFIEPTKGDGVMITEGVLKGHGDKIGCWTFVRVYHVT